MLSKGARGFDKFVNSCGGIWSFIIVCLGVKIVELVGRKPAG